MNKNEENLETSKKREELKELLRKRGYAEFWATRIADYLPENGLNDLAKEGVERGLEQRLIVKIDQKFGIRTLNDYISKYNPSQEVYSQIEQSVNTVHLGKLKFDRKSFEQNKEESISI